ncbi:MAG TPA: hypothetical protein VFV96_14430 [Verrucomicrobiae bacterium]|nr:hypothetical protein [Verrucomicrobiae bacterium]
MTPLEQDLQNALRDLEGAVQQMAATKVPVDLLPLFGRIDALAAQLPPGTDPQLLHFLQRKSFEKAALWLANRKSEITRGICGN